MQARNSSKATIDINQALQTMTLADYTNRALTNAWYRKGSLRQVSWAKTFENDARHKDENDLYV